MARSQESSVASLSESLGLPFAVERLAGGMRVCVMVGCSQELAGSLGESVDRFYAEPTRLAPEHISVGSDSVVAALILGHSNGVNSRRDDLALEEGDRRLKLEVDRLREQAIRVLSR